jgi:hypothetical protein
MELMDKILSSSKFISQNSEHVTINNTKIDMYVESELQKVFLDGGLNLSHWKNNDIPNGFSDMQILHWMFLIDSLNFSFWERTPGHPFVVNYKGKRNTGYASLCACINRAIDEGVDIVNPDFWSRVSETDMEHIFRGDEDVEFPMLMERMTVMRECGDVLLEKFDGDFRNVISQSENSSQKLMEIVLKHFSSYRDTSRYKGEEVFFYKRVQILVADIWSTFEGRSHGNFNDISKITMFADYRVPQILLYLGILEYSPFLLEQLKSNIIIQKGDPLESEIRGNSIYAVELIKNALSDSIGNVTEDVNSITIDYHLWTVAIQKKEEIGQQYPIHKTITTFY